MYNHIQGHGNYYDKNKNRKYGLSFYIVSVLITALICSTAVGGGLYYKFSSELAKQSEILKEGGIKDLSADESLYTSKNSFYNVALSQGSPVTEIAKKVGPAVVGIRLTVSNSQNKYYGYIFTKPNAEGSGVIINKDGYIMTNYHVVEYADPKNRLSPNTTLEVFLPDKRQAKAKFVGGDSKTDLAVIKIDLKDLEPAELGDSSELEVGEIAVAIGNPLGMEFAGSVTVGVISALNRTVETDNKTLNLIQTDAAINPGNSGGALVNSKGEVIGINTVKIAQQGVEGLGFAIPMNDAKPIVDQLRMFGYVKGRPFIGISGVEITEVISEQYNLPVGIYIQEIVNGSAAQNAGLLQGDILTNLAGKLVKTSKDLENIMKDYKAGDTVDMTVSREGMMLNLKLTFTEEK